MAGNDIEIAASFSEAAARFGPWVARHVIDGTAYGGDVDYSQDDRLLTCLDMWRPSGRILEVGCFEGGHTAVLASLPAVSHVHAVDGRDYLVEKTRIAITARGLSNVTVALCNADDPAAIEGLGSFDGVYCSGLLYHLLEPWKFLGALRRVSKALFLSTHFTGAPNSVRNGYDVQLVAEHGYSDPFSGLRAESAVPTIQSLARMIEDAGFQVADMRLNKHWRSPVHNVELSLANIICN